MICEHDDLVLRDGRHSWRFDMFFFRIPVNHSMSTLKCKKQVRDATATLHGLVLCVRVSLGPGTPRWMGRSGSDMMSRREAAGFRAEGPREGPEKLGCTLDHLHNLIYQRIGLSGAHCNTGLTKFDATLGCRDVFDVHMDRCPCTHARSKVDVVTYSDEGYSSAWSCLQRTMDPVSSSSPAAAAAVCGLSVHV